MTKEQVAVRRILWRPRISSKPKKERELKSVVIIYSSSTLFVTTCLDRMSPVDTPSQLWIREYVVDLARHSADFRRRYIVSH
jgi:hypothetical protein